MINFNGKLVDGTKEILSANNRAFKYGDGLFETLKVKSGKIIFLEDHYFRLMASMRMLRMEIPMDFTMEFLEDEILKTIERNNLSDARVRFTVYRKDGGLYKPETNKIDFVIEASSLNIAVSEVYKVDVFKDYYIYSGLLSTIKTTNKLTNVLASIYTSENRLDNCILVNEKKEVVEAINGNVFIVKGMVIKTPAIEQGCIKGIARKKIIELISKSTPYTIEEASFSPFELQKADEVFITNAIVGIQPVTNYKKSEFKSTVAKELSIAFNSLI